MDSRRQCSDCQRALLSKEEELLTKRLDPWGKGKKWSWKSVLKQHPDVETELVNYFSLMHAIVETAVRSEGICEKL